MFSKTLDTFGFCKAKRVQDELWVEGYLFKLDPPMTCFGEARAEPTWYIIQSQTTDWGLPCVPLYHQIDPNTVCPFTGYCIMEGNRERKLFAGDKVTFHSKHAERSGIITMLHGAWRIASDWVCNDQGCTTFFELSDVLTTGLTVTGNIRDRTGEEVSA